MLFLKFYNTLTIKHINLAAYIPSNTDIIIRFNKPFDKVKTLNANSILWKNAGENNVVHFLNKYINMSDSLPDKYTLINAIKQTEDLILCINNIKNGSFSWLLLFNSVLYPKEDELIQVIEDYKLGYHSAREYKNHKIYKLSDQNHFFYLCALPGAMAVSSNEILLETSVSDYNDNKKLTKVNNDVFANIIINNPDFSISNTVFKNLVPEYAYENTNLSNLDVYIEANILRLNGYVEYKNQNIILEQKEFELKKYIINNCSWFYTLSFNDINTIVRNRLLHLKDKSYSESINSALNEFNSKYNCDIEKDMLSWMNTDVLIMNFEKTEQDSIAKIILFNTSNYHQALQGLNKLAIKTDSVNYFQENYSGLEINKIHLPQAFSILFGELFTMPDYIYYAAIDDVIVFSSSKEIISNYINQLIKEDLLYRDLLFDKLYSENYSDKISSMLYLNDKKAAQTLVQDSIFPQNLIRSLSSFSWQTTNIKSNKVFCQYIYSFNFSDTDTIKPGNLWTYKLEYDLINSPHIVYNHISQSYNILVQDEEYNIYLFSNTGELLWKKQLDDKIIGKVSQIDIMGNGKLQLFFSTVSAVHLIDIKGNYVNPFPYQTSKDITAPAVAFDYENNHQYRFIIPSQNNLINIDKNGKITQGWNFSGATSVIVQSPLFFRINAKDYIVCNDREGNLYILDRKGNIRYDNNVSATDKSNENFVYEKAASIEACSFICTDTSGNLKRTFFNGKTEQLGKFSPSMKFILTNYFGDKQLIVADSGTVYKMKNSNIYTRSDKLIQENITDLSYITTNKELQIIVNAPPYAYIFNSKLSLLQKIPIRNNTVAVIKDINQDAVIEAIYSPGNRLLVVAGYK